MVLYDIYSAESIENYGQKLIGKTFEKVIEESSITKTQKNKYIQKFNDPRRKGSLGNLIEEVHYKKKANNHSGPDFEEAGVELKVTPYELMKNKKLRAGERLVITMIPYDKPVENEFLNSHVWEKMKLMLLIYYLRDRSKYSILDYEIHYVRLFSPPPEDLKIIESDYIKIIKKIREGRAHELSESDTLYLGACTKGSTSIKSTVPQKYYAPLVLARKRAFSFKNSYMTYILNSYIVEGVDTTESIIKNIEELKEKTFEELIQEKINMFINKTDVEISGLLKFPYTGNKAQWSSIVFRMLGIKSNKAKEFEKANVKVKTIRVESNGKIKEHMPLPAFDFLDLIKENKWEESMLYEYFEKTKFLFVVFKKEEGNYLLKGCQFWNMPQNDLNEEVRVVWENTIKTILDGIELNYVIKESSATVYNNLPSSKDNRVAHVRPHSQKRFYILKDGTKIGNGGYSDASKLPDGRWMQKQSFWINNSYLQDQLDTRLK